MTFPSIAYSFAAEGGGNINKFEKMICDYTGSEYAIATVNGTNALHISLLLSDVTIDDEVICQSKTFSASANPIAYLGATPVFVDCDEYYTIDVSKIEKQITSKTKKTEIRILPEGRIENDIPSPPQLPAKTSKTTN